MAKRKIVSINFKFPEKENWAIECVDITSDQSLFDADIIVIQPKIAGYYLPIPLLYKGKKSIESDDSFKLHDNIEHWREEFDLALEHGKNIFVFLGALESFYSSSITESNLVTNYDFLPINLNNIVSKSGKEIKVANELGILAGYWEYFKEFSCYKVYFDISESDVVLKTKTGNKAISAITPVKKGHLVLLPALEDGYKDILFKYSDKKKRRIPY